MQAPLDYTLVPTGYAHCFNAACPQAARCLRHLAAQSLTAAPEQIATVNPRRIADPAACPYFRSAEPVQLARGFMHALRTVPLGNASKVAQAVSLLYNQRYYYRMRKGEYSLTPAQQEQLAEILASYGASQPVRFDHYEEGYDW